MNELPKQPGRIWTAGHDTKTAPSERSKFALSELAEDWHFFNHGALFHYCGMKYPDDDPVADWYSEQPIGTELLLQPFKSLLFGGLESPIHLGNLTWGHVICGVRQAYWDAFLGFLGGIATIDREKKLYAQVFTGDVQILDPVLVERYSFLHPDVPHITVTVFCADTNKGRWEIRPPDSDASFPRFCAKSPRPEVVAMGKAVLGGDLAQLQHKDNPVFQPILDKFTTLRGGNVDEGSS